jgi:Protein of unknown function (DUF3887)
MSTRIFVFLLLAGMSLAHADPPKKPAHAKAPAEAVQPPDQIDVDAMARAKDVDSAASSDQSPPADATQVDASAPAGASASGETTAAPADSAAAETPQAAPAETDADTGTGASQAPATDMSPTTAAEPVPEPGAAASATPETPVDSAASDAAAEPADTTTPAADAAATAPVITPDEALRSIAAGCESRATSLLDEAEKADYESVTRDFDAKMRSALPPPKFKEQWESLGRFGKLVARGQSHVGTGEGYTIVIIPLIFEKKNLVAQIACGSDGRIAGFHVAPAPKPQF